MSIRRFLLVFVLAGIVAGAPASLSARPKPGGGGGAPGAGPLKIVRKLKGHQNSITTVAFGKDGTTLASGSLDSTVKIWDTTKEKGNPVHSVALGEGVILHKVAAHPSRSQYAVATTAGVFVYGQDGKQQQKLTLGKGAAEDVAYGPEGESIVAVFPDGVQTWTSDEGVKVKNNPKLKNGRSVAFRPTTPGLIAVGYEGKIALWYPSDNTQKDIKTSGEIVSLAFSPDGKLLASFGTDRTVRCYDVLAQKQVWEHSDVANDTKVTWAANGKVVISGGDGDTVRAFSASDGGDSWQYKAPSPNTRVVAVSPNGKLMASAGENEILVLTAK